MDKLYSSKGKNGRLLAATSREFHPAHAYGCAAQYFEGVQRGSIIVPPCMSSPLAAKPVLRRGGSRSAFPLGKSCHGVPADWLGTDGMYPFACYAAHQRPLSLSKNNRLLSSAPFAPYPFGRWLLSALFRKKLKKSKNAPVRKTRTGAKNVSSS